METMFVRLKPFNPKRGHLLRRYTFQGIKFHEERGWYRVSKDVAEHLKAVHQVAVDLHSPMAFDVCTEEQAKATDAKEVEAARVKKSPTDQLEVSVGRGDVMTTSDLPDANTSAKKNKKGT